MSEHPNVTATENISLVSEGAMTVREAVKFSRISRSDLYRFMESGRLPWLKPCRNRLIPRKALVDLMAAEVVKR